MASGSIAALRILLGLDASEYTRGLTRAEKQAQSFSTNVRKAILDVGAALGGLQIGREVFEATKAIIAEASALNDLADATGSSVEALSRLNNQSKIAGTDFATMQAAVLKLSQNLAGADDESQKATQALKLLGITTRDPAQAMQEIALKLNTYEDGVNKVALAVALFGKQGAALLPTLKDMANLQDVGATVSKKQAEEAEKLEQSYRRLSVDSQKYAQIILSDVIPAVNALIQRMIVGQQSAGSFGQGLAAMLSVAIRPGAVADQLNQVEESLARLKDEAKRGKFQMFPGAREETITLLEAQKQIILQARQQRALANATFSPSDTNPRDIIMGRKPAAPGLPGGGGGGAASRALKEQVSETERLIASLQKQVVTQQELNTVDMIELEIAKLRKDAKSGLTAEGETQLRILAREIDAGKEAERAAKALAQANKEAADEVQKRVDASRRANEQAQQEIDTIRGSVEQINLQILALTQGEKAVDAYNAAKREQLAVEKEVQANRAAADGDFALAAKYREAAQALRELNVASGQLRLAEDLKKEAQALQDVKNAISDTAANAFADFITGSKSAKDAFKSFCDDMVRQISRVAAQNLANALFGGKNAGGPDFFGVIGKLFGLLGGGGGTGSFTTPGEFGGGVPQLATGGVSTGGFAVVGENGPELVNLRAGSRVYSNEDSKGMLGKSVTIHQTVNVMPGANTQSARQAAARLRDVTLDAVRDR